jgi:hypothetical protein
VIERDDVFETLLQWGHILMRYGNADGLLTATREVISLQWGNILWIWKRGVRAHPAVANDTSMELRSWDVETFRCSNWFWYSVSLQ